LKTSYAALVVFLLAGIHGSAQQASQPAPGPSRQQQLMGYFVGDWTLTGTTKVSPTSPATPFHSTEHGEWVPGGYFVEIRSVIHGPLGDVHSVRMMEFNPEKQVYTYNAYNSLGEHEIAIGNVQGNTWTWNVEEKMNGISANGRYIVTADSPYAYTFKSEVQKPDGTWVTVREGKATRTGSK